GAPEHTRDLGRGRMDVVDLDETAVGRMILKPGWRWSSDVAPKMGTSTCQVRHLGAAVSGQLHVLVEDGSEMDIQAGDVYEIPPGHDGWVVGDVPWQQSNSRAHASLAQRMTRPACARWGRSS